MAAGWVDDVTREVGHRDELAWASIGEPEAVIEQAGADRREHGQGRRADGWAEDAALGRRERVVEGWWRLALDQGADARRELGEGRPQLVTVTSHHIERGHDGVRLGDPRPVDPRLVDALEGHHHGGHRRRLGTRRGGPQETLGGTQDAAAETRDHGPGPGGRGAREEPPPRQLGRIGGRGSGWFPVAHEVRR